MKEVTLVSQAAGSPSRIQASDAGHLAPGATHTTPQTVQGSELMRFAAAGDATLLIGGDLIVTVCQVCNIKPLVALCLICALLLLPIVICQRLICV